MTPLESAALLAGGWAIGGLALSVARAWRRPTAAAVAAPAGEAWRGVLYAFGPGMSPRAKESASTHPAVYAAGVAYHLGVFSALATLALMATRARVPAAVGGALAIVLAVGVLAGLGLFARRIGTPLLREISALDDYAANLIVDAWLLAAAISWLAADARSPLLVVSIGLGLYAPLGKIRHCVFFFASRWLFGARLGRRGLVGAAPLRTIR